jgi:hypothetical protein
MKKGKKVDLFGAPKASKKNPCVIDGKALKGLLVGK